MKKIIAVLLLPALLLAMTSCKSGNPNSTYTYHSIFSQQPQPSLSVIQVIPSAPQQSAPPDMAPGPWPNEPGCNLNFYPEESGIFQPDALTVEARWDIRCNVKIVVFLLIVRLQFKNVHGQWDDEDQFTTIENPIPMVPQIFDEHAVWSSCYPGWWRIEVHWSGADNFGTAFGQDKIAKEEQLSCT